MRLLFNFQIKKIKALIDNFNEKIEVLDNFVLVKVFENLSFIKICL